ncbi:MAG TPA: NAD(P)/FAD-dependent oxidoreductase [Candidatus Sulfotelmatobacter sp.]|nr:NAD(P)/FAD-dependent oxidoreductase [Candidatus Sulfotelmatobacter sp.]
MSIEHFDVVVVGAGLSGIGAAYRLQTRCPGKRYVIFEARSDIGGTWDLFRYPGVRSDSDMFTLGYPFRPWSGSKALADGPSILRYVRDTAREFGIELHIRFQHRVESARWSSEEARWTLEVSRGAGGDIARYTCDFLYGCTGYYRYDGGYEPGFPGADRFRGQIVHPQRWPEDLNYAGKKVVVIGSGATAVTLVPAMAATAGHVTMLQRSPGYILSLPDHDPVADWLRQLLPAGPAHRIVRWKNILISLGIYQLSRRAPSFTRELLRGGAAKNLPQGYDVGKHFNPRYQPWDQRLCLVPNSDLFKAISQGKASVVTDEIETFTENGIRLQSGEELAADIIVTATGLQMLALGGVRLVVDGTPIHPGEAFVYKGTMLGNVPNFAFCIGYTNASWTLRADLASTFVCRLLNHMDRHQYRISMPVCDPQAMESRPLLDLTSGYVMRAAANLPKQAARQPWVIRQNYILDMLKMKLGRMEDGVLKFQKAPPAFMRRAAAEEIPTATSAGD